MIPALLALVLVTASPALNLSPPQPSPADLEAGLAGQWAGTLSYRDYQSDKMVDLPMRSEIRALDDGATVLNIATFDDQSGNVIITTVELFNRKAGTVDNVAIRLGKPIDRESDKVSLVAYSDAQHWTLQFDHDGMDGKVRAKIRSIETRDGDTLSSEEDFVPLAAKKKDWVMRNVTKLTRAVTKTP
jgi:hypothetical protein